MPDELYTELFNFNEQREYQGHADFKTDEARLRHLQQKRKDREPEIWNESQEQEWTNYLRERPARPPAWLKSTVF